MIDSTWTITPQDGRYQWFVTVGEDTGEGNAPTEEAAMRDIANALDFLKGNTPSYGAEWKDREGVK